MKFGSPGGFSTSFSRSRRALAQPRFLLATLAMASALGGASYLATAQTKLPSVKMRSASTRSKPVTLSDLPGLVQSYGANRTLTSASKTSGTTSTTRSKTGSQTRAISNGDGTVSGFNLTEVDLTSGSPSDEREPVYSPDGSRVLFRSNGADSNNDGKIDALGTNGKYHIWVMNSDGTGQTQLTGKTNSDRNVDQFRPSWAPDGNQLVYVNGTGAGAQLFTVTASGGTPQALTSFSGEKASPAWAPSGLVITFASKTNPVNGAGLGQFDLFSIDTSGDTGSVQRLTGGENDPIGDVVDDLNPAYGAVNTNAIFFSSNRDADGPITGRRIFRVELDAPPTQFSDPTKRVGGLASDVDDFPALSLAKNFTNFQNGNQQTVLEQLAFQTNSAIDAADAAQSNGRDLNIWSLTAQNVNTTTSAIPSYQLRPEGTTISQTEEGGVTTVTKTAQANVLTNSLSSPATSSSTVVNGGQDRAADREPSFTRASSSAQTIATLAFASTRVYAPNPKITAVQNASGGTSATATHDIWTTGTVDTTPATLIPQSVGNNTYPVVFPLTGDALDVPNNAARTYKAGLRPNALAGTAGSLKLGVVLSDQQSGLSTAGDVQAVTATFYNATARNYEAFSDVVNDNLAINIAHEIPQTIPAQMADGSSASFRLQPFDDGTNERQADAVAGDGTYYCFADLPTPPAGDYYITITATDLSGNTFTYDNIWGFSTEPFAKANTNLLVSDYGCGQVFPNQLAVQSNRGGAGDDGRFASMDPIESYYLDNPGGSVTSTDGLFTFQLARTTTFENIDTWRVLCRGSVPAAVMNSYRPTTVAQIDPNETTAGPGGPFTAKTRLLPLATSAIVWASPYAGTVFAGPGTIDDPATQDNLTAFTNAGGRLFVSGRDVAWALSNAGAATNTFLQNVLGAQFSSERSSNVLTAGPGGFLDSLTGSLFGNAGATFRDLQIPLFNSNPADYSDAAFNQDPNVSASVFSDGADVGIAEQAVGIRPDIITPTSSGSTTTTPSYTIGTDNVVGQRIERNADLPVRTVFFSFGLEGINRRYRSVSNSPVALDIRYEVARGILTYLKTGSISGTVTDVSTNRPVANFLIKATSNIDGSVYLTRTDASGNYSFPALPSTAPRPTGTGTAYYTVEPAYIINGRLTTDSVKGATSPSGFFGGTPRLPRVIGGFDTSGVNFNVRQLSPGSISGTVVATNLNDPTTTAPVSGLYVLLVSKNASSTFTGGGQFTSITKTNTSGKFSFSGVPVQTDLQVILNPTVADIPVTSGLRDTYQALQDAGQFQSGEYIRRVISGTDRPGPDTTNTLVVPSGTTYVLNDSNPDTQTESNSPLVVSRFVASVTGKVTVNGTARAGTSVALVGSNGATVQTTTTNASGIYTFTNVIKGSYTATATSGSKSASKTFTVSSKTTVSVASINIVQPVLSGKVVAKLVGTKTSQASLSGATVTLLDSNGKTLNPSVITTSASDGTYQFTDIADGTYKLRATFAASQGSVTSSISAAVTVRGGNAKAPDLSVSLFQISGKVVNSRNSGQSGATVSLLAGGTTLQTVTASSSGTFSFSNLLSGNYTLRATTNTASGQATVSIAANATSVPSTNITLEAGSNSSVGATVFNTIGQTYLISIPYEDTNNPSSSNFSETTGGVAPATTKVTAAFSVPPVAADGTVNFTLERLDPVTGNYVALDNNSNIVRGVGYRLKVVSAGTALKLPGTDSTRVALNDATTASTFVVTLHTAGAGSATTSTSGLNLIGFGLNPDSFSQVDRSSITVTHPTDGTVQGIDAAAAKGWMSSTVKTINGQSGNSSQITADLFQPYRGYLVTTKVDGLTLTFRSATTFAANGQYLVSFPYATSNSASSTLTVNQAFTSALGSSTFRLYRFNASGQVNDRSKDLVQITSGTTKLQRGVGYLLQTVSEVALRTPATTSSVVPFTGTEFSIPLTWNNSFMTQTGATNNRNNGYNFVGFPFDPSQYTSVSFDDVQLTYGSTTYASLTDAAAAGIIDQKLYVLDSNNNFISLASRSITPYQAYFVRLLRNDQTPVLVLRNPKK